jgi:hypothetical protein
VQTPFTDILVPLDGSQAAERALVPPRRQGSARQADSDLPGTDMVAGQQAPDVGVSRRGRERRKRLAGVGVEEEDLGVLGAHGVPDAGLGQ